MNTRLRSFNVASAGFFLALTIVALTTPSCGEGDDEPFIERRTDSLNAPDGGWPDDPADLIARCGLSEYPYPNVTLKYCSYPNITGCGRMSPLGDPSTSCRSEVCIFRDNCGTEEACCTLRHELEHAKQWDRICSKCQADHELPANRSKCTLCLWNSCNLEAGAEHAACMWGGGETGSCGDECLSGDAQCVNKLAMSFKNPPLPSACAYLGFDHYRDIAPICNAVFGDLCNTCRCPRAPGQTVVENHCGERPDVVGCNSKTCTLPADTASSNNNDNSNNNIGSTTRACVSDACTVKCSTLYGGTLGWLVESQCPLGTCPLQGELCNAHGEQRTVACQ